MDTMLWIKDFVVFNWPWLLVGIVGASFQYYLDN
jgi:hypothetical protein